MRLPGGETKVLLVARDASVIEQVQLACQNINWLRFVGHVTRPEEAATAARQRQADVVLLDDSVLDDTKQVVMDIALAAPDLLVLILVTGRQVEKVQEALLSGARGFITKPISAESFANAIARIVTLERLRHSKEEGESQAKGSIYALVSAKGAVGKSILAVNIGVALKKLEISPVLVVELMSLPGDTPVLLNLLHPITLEDVLENDQALSSAYLLQNLVQYEEGVYVLPSTRSYLNGEFTAQEVRSFLNLMTRIFKIVIVDTGELQDPLTEVALSEADKVFVILAPDLLTLHRTIKFWQALKESELISVDKVAIVLNQGGKEWGLSRSRLEQLMDTNFWATVRYDAETVEESIRRGVPFVRAFKRSSITQDVMELAKRMSGREEGALGRSPFGQNKGQPSEGKESSRSRWKFFS